jgi:hypothetical protein
LGHREQLQPSKALNSSPPTAGRGSFIPRGALITFNE